jgi:pimeloyl-ACP methyl ester carboxylesterase
VLLHGFPTSSILAPDYPGFGFSAFPPKDEFEYTFKNISSLINKFTEKIGLSSFSIYLHDYGCPIGLRLCVSHPEKIEKIIVQNGNAYKEGLGSQWDETRDYWKNPTEEKKKKISGFLSEEGVNMQYTAISLKTVTWLLKPILMKWSN